MFLCQIYYCEHQVSSCNFSKLHIFLISIWIGIQIYVWSRWLQYFLWLGIHSTSIQRLWAVKHQKLFCMVPWQKFPFCTALQELQFCTSLLCSKSCFFLALNSLLNQNSQAFAIFLLIQWHPSYPLHLDLTSLSADCIPSRLNLCCAQIWLIDCLLMVHEVVILWILTSALTELFTISCSTSFFTLMISSIECCLKTLHVLHLSHL